MKKLIVSLAGLLLATSVSFGGSLSKTVAQGSRVAVFTNASFKITSITWASTNACTASLIDAYDTTWTVVTPAYTNYTQYATNYVTTWVNYYGTTNSYTNFALVTTSNSVASVTNTAPSRGAIACSANSSTTLSPVSYQVWSGLWVTNTSGTGTLTINYAQ